jgi:hypothetical protein
MQMYMFQVSSSEPDAGTATAVADPNLAFIDLSRERGPKIPTGFAIDKIVSYLTSVSVSLSLSRGDSSDDECADAGTKKPAVKGRRMYNSEKLGMCEAAIKSDGSLVFRANCDASLRRQLCRYPQVIIDANGNICGAQCTCEASSDGRCCHVAALLYLAEDLSLGVQPKVRTATTSTQQSWGKGKMTGKEPLPVYASRYGKKLAPDRYIGFNPVQGTAVPEDANKSKDVFLRGLQSHPKTSMWEMLLRYQYSGMNQHITFSLLVHSHQRPTCFYSVLICKCRFPGLFVK